MSLGYRHWWHRHRRYWGYKLNIKIKIIDAANMPIYPNPSNAAFSDFQIGIPHNPSAHTALSLVRVTHTPIEHVLKLKTARIPGSLYQGFLFASIGSMDYGLVKSENRRIRNWSWWLARVARVDTSPLFLLPENWFRSVFILLPGVFRRRSRFIKNDTLFRDTVLFAC